MFQPLAADDVAVPAIFRRPVLMPPANVEVAVEVPTKYCAPTKGDSMPAENVEVLVFVTVSPLAVTAPFAAIVVVPVAPKAALFAVTRPLYELVLVALV